MSFILMQIKALMHLMDTANVSITRRHWNLQNTSARFAPKHQQACKFLYLAFISMKIKQILLPILIASLLACNTENSNTSIQTPPRLIQIDTTDRTQFIAIIVDSAEKNIQLTKSDLAIIDHQIKVAVSDYNVETQKFMQKIRKEDPTRTLRREDFIIDLKNYKRQYVSYINKKKQKEVWVNCFCSNRDNDEWKSKIIEVRDGGKCYFNLKIVIEQKSYYEFMVNSRA
jgi:hypothetical protein